MSDETVPSIPIRRIRRATSSPVQLVAVPAHVPYNVSLRYPWSHLEVPFAAPDALVPFPRLNVVRSYRANDRFHDTTDPTAIGGTSDSKCCEMQLLQCYDISYHICLHRLKVRLASRGDGLTTKASFMNVLTEATEATGSPFCVVCYFLFVSVT